MGIIASISPSWAVKRAKSRIWLRRYQAAEARFETAGSAIRSYDAAKRGRRLGGWLAKFGLVCRASYNRGFALPHLPIRGRR